MRSDIFPRIGEALSNERRKRGLNQAALAARLGRSPARISELERDLKTSRFGKDRLTLLAEICDALDLVPVLVPRDQLSQEGAGESRSVSGRQAATPLVPPSVFDDVFVDLGDEPEDEDRG